MVDTTLGPCHYSEDMSEQATLLGVREDGPGWIPICENHRSDAESDGYKVQEVQDLPDAIETNEAEGNAHDKHEDNKDDEQDKHDDKDTDNDKDVSEGADSEG